MYPKNDKDFTGLA